MLKNEFLPENDLEKLIVDAYNGKTTMVALIETLLKSSIYVLSATEVHADMSNFTPVIFENEGKVMYPIFTDPSRIGHFSSQAPYCLKVNAMEFFKRVPQGQGIVVNLGFREGFEISSEALSRIVSR